MALPTVADYWTHGNLMAAILDALVQDGRDIDNLTLADVTPRDHLHGRGVAATRDLVAHLEIIADHHVLDIGSGVGGPARFIADTYGCRVTGIDLTPEFCDVANQLTERLGMADRVALQVGDAMDLPFDDASFDAAMTHNVSMNVPDKRQFFAEAFRVLRPGARFAAAEIAAGPGGPPILPAPWAETAETSHLTTVGETRALLDSIGFEVLDVIDGTQTAIAFYEESRARIARDGPPRLGVHIILGDGAKEKLRNSAANVEQGRTLPIEFVCRRPT